MENSEIKVRIENLLIDFDKWDWSKPFEISKDDAEALINKLRMRQFNTTCTRDCFECPYSDCIL